MKKGNLIWNLRQRNLPHSVIDPHIMINPRVIAWITGLMNIVYN